MTAPGYILPGTTAPLPKNLTLKQFLQTVLVGISGIPGDLVRPNWQPEPPKNPPLETNWIGFGIANSRPDANAWQGVDDAGGNLYQRHELLEIECHIYGPDCEQTYGYLRDGFQIDQNRFALFQANIGFTEISDERHVPDRVNERWIDRVITSIFLRRMIQRSYPVLTLLSASGTIFSPLQGNDDYSLPWLVNDDE